VEATGLAYDAAICARNQRLEHCIILPGSGLMMTATQACAPLLQPNCVAIAQETGLHVLLLRYGSARAIPDPAADARACPFRHDSFGHLVAQEGYQPAALTKGVLLLRHTSPNIPEYQVSASDGPSRSRQ
jgi:hypothetical protein